MLPSVPIFLPLVSFARHLLFAFRAYSTTDNGCVGMDDKEVAAALQLQKLKGRIWNVQPSTATNGDGLAEGLKWLSENVKDTPAPGKK